MSAGAAAAAIVGAHYYVVGPVPAQDGALVWVVVRSLEACGRTVPVAEYMSEHAAIRGAHEYTAAAQRAAGMAA